MAVWVQEGEAAAATEKAGATEDDREEEVQQTVTGEMGMKVAPTEGGAQVERAS